VVVLHHQVNPRKPAWVTHGLFPSSKSNVEGCSKNSQVETALLRDLCVKPIMLHLIKSTEQMKVHTWISVHLQYVCSSKPNQYGYVWWQSHAQRQLLRVSKQTLYTQHHFISHFFPTEHVLVGCRLIFSLQKELGTTDKFFAGWMPFLSLKPSVETLKGNKGN